MKSRIHACPISGLTLSGHIKGLIEELERTSVCLFLIFHFKRLRKFKEGTESAALAYDQVTQVRRKGRNEMKSIESLCQNFIESQQSRRIISFQECIHKSKTILIVKHIQIA